MTRRVIEVIIFCRCAVRADHERDATLDLKITLSSMFRGSAFRLTEYSVVQNILSTRYDRLRFRPYRSK
ncbi:hypothetical protein X741_22185 [Mesorhizobium sp. LNHC229A00]|nr:hypothetical protein X741_22185 [Mesorhizobium sp. LNHC229A00]